jgi:hypothetical protein
LVSDRGAPICGGAASLDAFHVVKAALPEIDALEKATKKTTKR